LSPVELVDPRSPLTGLATATPDAVAYPMAMPGRRCPFDGSEATVQCVMSLSKGLYQRGDERRSDEREQADRRAGLRRVPGLSDVSGKPLT